MRNLRSMFDALGLEYDKVNRTRVDRAIRSIVRTPDGAHCPEVWSALKSLTPQESAELPARVSDLLRTPDA
jgi:hypothetical protein